MTHDELRDIFATHAMLHLLPSGAEGIGVKAYDIADEMMRARAGIPLKVVEPQLAPKYQVPTTRTKPAETVPPKPEVPWHEKPWSGKKDGDPKKHWVIWTRNDMLKLVRLHDNKVPIEAIAKALDRKPQSIKTALYRLKAGLPVGVQPKSKKEGAKK